MEHFRTPIQITASPLKLDYPQSLFSIGSCFAEHMHARFVKIGFKSFCNPCGIVYNPISIGRQMKSVLNSGLWSAHDILSWNGLYHGLHHHGMFSSSNLETTLHQMNTRMSAATLQLEQSTTLLMTWGSAIVYRHIDTNTVVANCHKLPATAFERKLLTVEQIVAVSSTWIEACIYRNSKINIILTISPVRYLKEGFTDNNRSKARLIMAAEALCEAFDQVHYFPAYEILLDDLRDYRFYKEDMVHPSNQAIDYIWDLFKQTYCSKDTLIIMHELDQIKKAKAHRPLHPDTEAHKKFLDRLEQSKQALKIKYPDLDLE